MANDLMERLRDTVQILATTQMNLSMEDWDMVSNAVLDAAGAIKRLRDDNSELTRRETKAAARIEQLEAALRPLACTCEAKHQSECCRSEVDCPFWNARAALGEKA